MARKGSDTSSFTKWLEQALKDNPKLSATKAVKTYRSETGKKISNEKGKEAYRTTTGKEYNEKKAVRRGRSGFHYKPMDEAQKHYYDKYAYVVSYRVQGEAEPRYVTVVSDEKLSKKKILEQAREYVKEGIDQDKKNYHGIKRVFKTSFDIARDAQGLHEVYER